jgi:hypothetical protein
MPQAERERRAFRANLHINLAPRIYTEKDADLRWLKRKISQVIGLGAQGCATFVPKNLPANLFGRWKPVRGVAQSAVGERLRSLMRWK